MDMISNTNVKSGVKEMAKETAPTTEEWERLYRAAVSLRELAPWRWMMDSEVFGVQDPVTGEVGYYAVLGALGEVLGIVVYMGTAGLEAYRRMASAGGAPVDQFDAMAAVRGFSCFFGSRNELDRADLDVIKHLGVKFRGSSAWPLIRSQRPYYIPWFLNSEEARYLALVLEQATIVASRLVEDEDLLDPPRPGLHFVRVPVVDNGDLSWTDRWLAPKPRAGEPPLKGIQVDLKLIGESILKRRKTSMVLEADVFSIPAPVEGAKGERPYYPRMVLWVNLDGLVLHFDLFEPDARFLLQESLVRLIAASKGIPGEIRLHGATKISELAPLADQLGINLVNVRALRALPHAKKSLLTGMGAL